MIRKNLARALSFCLVTGWIACHTSGVTALAAETDTSMTGELAFAQCEEYINIRQEPDENGEVVAKIYNDNAATIISKTGDWYQITSGNAFGYVKADYLVTGDEASAIAEKVQYHIARIHPEELYIRSEKSEESTAVGSVHQADEVDAVSYDNGAWIQIVADDGTKGYINAYYADYLTCYPVAETLEEEQDRLRNQADTSETGEGSGQGAIYGVEKAAEYTEPVSYDSESSSDTGSVADGSGNDGYTESSDSYDSGYSEENTDTSTADGSQDYSTDTSGDESWDNSSDASDDTTWSDTSDSGSADSTGSGDSYTESDNSTAETDGSYSEPDNSYIEPEAPETDASYSEPETSAPETDAPYTEPETSAPETDAPYTEPETSAPETDAPYTEPGTSAPETEAPETEAPATEDTSSSSDLGQQIASYAVQFVGNPYVYGGTSLTNGADCSGFVQSVFANFGIGLSRTAASQASGGTSVSFDSLQAGDLLFYSSSGSIDHVALYIGGGQIVHAANSASGIIISNAYYSTPVAARRYW
ncbi:C40 family peptidase [Lachnospiraceae bacterium Marseille-Q4251]|nr:C40 family peptidase [Lachnospiraceae bacterium Marseille-Q4251]